MEENFQHFCSISENPFARAILWVLAMTWWSLWFEKPHHWPKFMGCLVWSFHGNTLKSESPILMKCGVNVVFKKIFDRIVVIFFFLFWSEMRSKGYWRNKNYLQNWGRETYFVRYLGNYWRYRFLCKLIKLMFFNIEFNVAKKPLFF